MSGRRKKSLEELKSMSGEYLCTIREVSMLTGMAEQLVRAEMVRGTLKSMEIGSGEELRIPKFRIRQWEREATLAGEKRINRILRKVG